VALTGYGVWEYGRNNGWWGETNQMRALKADPLAAEQLVGLRRIWVQQTQPSGFLGKPGPQIHQGWYAPDSGSRTASKDAVARYAESQGFTYDAVTSTGRYWNGWKPTDRENVKMSVSIQIDERDDNPPSAGLVGTVRVTLAYL
jgi:hypothetical protein